MTKYELDMNDNIKIETRTLHRIKAIRNFGNVKIGDLGGYIENEDNLSHDDNCWIYDNARVYGRACVYDDAIVKDNVIISGRVEIQDNAIIKDSCIITGDEYSSISIGGNATISGNVKIFPADIGIYDNVHISENAQITGNAYIIDNVNIRGNTEINFTKDYKEKGVYPIDGFTIFDGDAVIHSDIDYISIYCVDVNGMYTFYRNKFGELYVSSNSSFGTNNFDKFIEYIEKMPDTNERTKILTLANIIKLHFI